MKTKQLKEEITKELKGGEIESIKGNVVTTTSGDIVSFSKSKAPIAEIKERIQNAFGGVIERAIKEINLIENKEKKEEEIKTLENLLNNSLKLALLYNEMVKRLYNNEIPQANIGRLEERKEEILLKIK